MSRIFKVKVRLHATWIAAVLLFIATIVTQFPEIFSLWERIFFGSVAAALFCLAILLREYILLTLAVSRGVRVKSLTVYLFGGVRQETAETTLPVLERLMAVAGLVVSLAIASFFYAGSIVFVVVGNETWAGLGQWLSLVLLLVAVLHFAPGLPLDGGRLIASYLWQARGKYYQAVRSMTWGGYVLGTVFVLYAVALAGSRQWLDSLTMLLVAWCLLSGASLSRRQASFHESLDGFSAGQVMTRHWKYVSPSVTVRDVVRDYVLTTGQRYFVVMDAGTFEGVVTLRRLRSVPKRRWGSTQVGKIMIPAERAGLAHAEQSANALLQQMDDMGVSELPVLGQNGEIGVASRESLVRLAQTRAHLRI